MDWSELHTRRLWLRRPVPEDLPAVHALHSDPATNRYNPAGPIQDRATTAGLLDGWIAHWRQHGYGYWVVRDRYGTSLGVAGARHTTVGVRPALNLYYRFAPIAWGHGYATEAARAAIAVAADAGLPLVAIVHPDNGPSQRVAERVGLRRVGDTVHHGSIRWLYATDQWV